MNLSQQIKPISYLKAHAAEVIKRLRGDIESYERTQQSLTLLKILTLGNKQIENGRTETASSVIKRLRDRKKNQRNSRLYYD